MTKLNIPPVSLDSKSVLCLTVTIYQSSFEKFYVTKSYFRIFKLVLLVAAVGFVSTRFAQVKLFNWSYKDFGTNAFTDISLDQRQHYHDFPTGTCPDGWVRFSDSCYWIEQHKQSFAEAEKRCYEKNATLFVVNSQDEWDAVREHFPQTGYTWIGLVRFTHFEKSQDAPIWQTEGAVNPTRLNWLIRPYKPVSNGWSALANCAAHFSAAINWDASAYTYFQPCSFKFYSICERNGTILDFLNRKFDFQD
ncbi:C-type lectin domain-containing protein [Caenorhabditis elegans]|uniref:C-type lectin domain-containing protein n=1 Tax=Caenorhabditis elegans TaxID=6239 RepID=H2KZ07_CAEEL|nr:C-type lectin domain-containing protein [Caenorhabditis elegans]CCD65631.1 C-type lectin domain-containing protein [Caenorhabditis elegans]|eukprot:NP_001024428.1 C-type LECtin [Caenorhabditis elegans]